MALPNFFLRILWVWGFFGILLVALTATGLLMPQPTIAPAPGPGETAIVLRDPDGVSTGLTVEVADEPQEWRLGLMNRPVVERGMLFVFPAESPQSFWMKDTLVPLDIAFFRADGTWVSSATMEPCRKDPCPSYPSAGPASFALELAVGGIGSSIGSGWTLDVLSGS